MINRAVRAAILMLVAALSLAAAAQARAARVLVLGPHHRVTVRTDRYLPAA